MTDNAGLSPFQKFCATLQPVPSEAVYRANLLLRSEDLFPQDADQEALYIAFAFTPARAAIDWLERLYHEKSASYARAAFGRLSNTNKGLVLSGYGLKYIGVDFPPRLGRVWYSLFVVKDELKSEDDFPVTSYQNAGIWPFFDRKTISPKEVAKKVKLELDKLCPVSWPKLLRIGENGSLVGADSRRPAHLTGIPNG
ncbi:hypothetical protein [Ralstonia sp. SET104]|uniref:hypothetical protein n=1 Tax=Ralstonia sp. SET104 TaxID=2448774 RepID=UPI000F563042|nr:hypothetical protein [Ralstonia sp. SET104]GCB02603.1 hypothetical protein PSUB009319_02340 [Ralstonia sp. SET104]